MRVAILAKGDSIHTIRWANGLYERGYDIHLISMEQTKQKYHPGVHLHLLGSSPPFGYFLNRKQLRDLLESIQPDILHAHFASGYGTLARSSGFHPFVLSVWGSDVYEFPAKSFLHHNLVVANLHAADWICSTSHSMREQTLKLSHLVKDKISVTPFGIDCNVFKPVDGVRNENHITIGTVKTLIPKYGIDLLIKAFANLYNQLANSNADQAERLRLIIVGGSPTKPEDNQIEALKSLCTTLGIQELVTFVGQIDHIEVPKWLNRFDIYVALSRSESFGVAVLEASACGLPVIVSDVGGLPEVVISGETGLVVPGEDYLSASKALERMVVESDLRKKMGISGREFVLQNYQWSTSLSLMEDIYKGLASAN